MCARPPFELVSVSPAREAKSAPSALPMEGFNREARGQPNASPSLDRYAPYRTQSARKDELPADMRGFRSVQSGPAGLTHSTETSAASLATGTGPEAKAERGAYSLAPDLESLAQSTLPRETSAQVPSFRAFSEGCSSSQARCATTSGCGSNSHRGATASGCGSTRPVVICGGGSSGAQGCRGAGASSHGCAPASCQGSTGSGPTELQRRQHVLQGLRGHTAGLSRETAAAATAAEGVPRVRPSIARVTARRVVKRKAMEEAALPSDTSNPSNPSSFDAAGVGSATAAAAGRGVPSVKPTFGDLEDLWRTDSEAKTYCSSVCSAPAMCRSGQEGVAGPTPEIPGMIVAESSRRKRMRSAAGQSAMALLV